MIQQQQHYENPLHNSYAWRGGHWRTHIPFRCAYIRRKKPWYIFHCIFSPIYVYRTWHNRMYSMQGMERLMKRNTRNSRSLTLSPIGDLKHCSPSHKTLWVSSAKKRPLWWKKGSDRRWIADTHTNAGCVGACDCESLTVSVCLWMYWTDRLSFFSSIRRFEGRQESILFKYRKPAGWIFMATFNQIWKFCSL